MMEADTGRKFFYLPARVINNSVSRQYNIMTINKGQKHGIVADMAVISENGVAGIIAESSENFSTILPVINRNFRLSAKIERNNYFGIIEWDGRDPDIVNLREIPNHVEVFPGDTIVTSGYSAIFPEGIKVGVVESHEFREGNFYEIKVRLSTNFRQLQHVNTIISIYREEQQELEEATN
jgi:rod shape-determining protein MreC